MQSFSPFKPVLNGTPSEVRTATFAMWLRANAFNVRRPFDRARWKTSRPWLRFSALQYQMKLYRERTLGAIVLGGITLKDCDVERAMKYEAYATRQICKSDVKRMILEFYDFSRTVRIGKTDVLENINKEFVFLDRGCVKNRSFNWKNATREFCERSYFTLKPKISEHDLAKLIWCVFKPGKKTLTVRDIFEKLAPSLNAIGEIIHENSPILRRALLITSCKLEYLEKREMVEKVVDRYYVRHDLGSEPLQRLQFVVNFVTPIRADDPVWNSVDLHLVPKHDWNLPGYEEAYAEEYDNPPEVTPDQEPFMRYRLPYAYIRKKQKIPWKLIIEKCKRKGGTDKRTLAYTNNILKSMGFVPMAFCHPSFDILKVQGVRLSKQSYLEFFPEELAPPVLSLESPYGPKTPDVPSGGAELVSLPEKIVSHSTRTCAASPGSETSHALARS